MLCGVHQYRKFTHGVKQNLRIRPILQMRYSGAQGLQSQCCIIATIHPDDRPRYYGYLQALVVTLRSSRRTNEGK
jgi:hypothetical protein